MIGNIVKKERVKKGYTQKELGKRVGITYAAISKLESKGIASNQILIGLGRELETDFDLEWLREHFEKYPLPQKDLMELLTDTIRAIVKEELHKEKYIVRKMFNETLKDTKISRHQKKDS